MLMFHKKLNKMVEVEGIDFTHKSAFAPKHHKDLDYKSSYFDLDDLDIKIGRNA